MTKRSLKDVSVVLQSGHLEIVQLVIVSAVNLTIHCFPCKQAHNISKLQWDRGRRGKGVKKSVKDVTEVNGRRVKSK
jgi:hypothetical protein